MSPARKMQQQSRSFTAWLAVVAASVALRASAQSLPIQELQLPPLRIGQQLARAHTQGLEIIAGQFYVTARRDDVQPRRALLLRSAPGRADWDSWDITATMPSTAGNVAMDHPGGLQGDGRRLWIPVAESRRHGRSQIRVFALSQLQPGKAATPEFEFAVADHIGAMAVSLQRREVLGASWDTEEVYVWKLDGARQRQWSANDLESKGLGLATGTKARAGVAIQDWKIQGDTLYASGLFKQPGSTPSPPQSRLLVCRDYWKSDSQVRFIALERHQGRELAQEAMALSENFLYFLPEDMGAANRVFRVPLTEVLTQAKPLLPAAAR